MKKSILAAFLALATIFTSACGASDTGGKVSFRSVSAGEAQKLMATEKDYIILDVRTRQEYNTGHIPNAICIPNETIADSKPEELPNKEQLIFVYCRSGARSKDASKKLANIGYTNIVEFGGIIDWTGDIVN